MKGHLDMEGDMNGLPRFSSVPSDALLLLELRVVSSPGKPSKTCKKVELECGGSERPSNVIMANMLDIFYIPSILNIKI